MASASTDELVRQITDARGGLIALAAPHDVALAVLAGVRDGVEDLDDVAQRMVLGRSCATAAQAIDHIGAVLQLPYGSTRGWDDFIDSLDQTWMPQGVLVVMDAAHLLEHEDVALWHQLVRNLSRQPGCFRRTWTTLVLLDDELRWARSRFQSADAVTAIRP